MIITFIVLGKPKIIYYPVTLLIIYIYIYIYIYIIRGSCVSESFRSFEPFMIVLSLVRI